MSCPVCDGTGLLLKEVCPLCDGCPSDAPDAPGAPRAAQVIRNMSIAVPYRSQSKMSAASFSSLEEVDPNSPKAIRQGSKRGNSKAAPVQDSFTTADGAVEEEDCDPNSPKLMAGRRKSKQKRADPFGEQENQPQEEQAQTVNVGDFGMLDEIDPNSPKSDPGSGRRVKSKATSAWDAQPHEGQTVNASDFGMLDEIDPNSPKSDPGSGRRVKSKATSAWDVQPHEDETAASSLQGMESHSSPCDDAAEQPGDEEPVTIRMRELPNEFIRRGSKEASSANGSAGPTIEDSERYKKDPLVMYVVLRKDLDWPVGAMINQASHATAAVAWAAREDPEAIAYFTQKEGQMTTSTMGVNSEAELMDLAKKLEEGGVPHKLWVEMPEGMPASLATYPRRRSAVQKLFKKLKRY